MRKLIDKLFFSTHTGAFIQFFRYAIVGGIATVVDLFIFQTLAAKVGVDSIISNTFSFSAGLLVNFYISMKWVFHRYGEALKKEFLPFAIVGVIGLLFSNIILYILLYLNVLYLISGLEGDILKFVAKVITAILVLFWNFFARKKIIQYSDKKRNR